MRRFQLDGLSVACTSLHSDDESVFDLVFPEAGSREVLDDQIDTLITNGPAVITRPSGN
jgi:hypothetical protein